MKKLNREDVLNALLADSLANAIVYAHELGYSRKEVEAAVKRGQSNGFCESRHPKAKAAAA